MKVILSVTWWRLLQKLVVGTKFNIYIFFNTNINQQNKDWATRTSLKLEWTHIQMTGTMYL
jgi:hypothetical protein